MADRLLGFILLLVMVGVGSEKIGLTERGRYPDAREFMKKVRRVAFTDAFDAAEPLTVSVGLFIESLSNFDPTEMAFDQDMYMRISWYDHRFAHNHSTPYVITRKDDIKEFWIPDMYFKNAKSSYYQDLLRPNTFIRIFPNGEVFLSVRVTLNAACNQNLQQYPLDRQLCGVKIASFSHPTTKLKLRWVERKPVTGNSEMQLAEMAVIGYDNLTCDKEFTYAETDSYKLRGKFSCLFAAIRLERLLGYHMVQTYIPTGLIVVISWVSFWIDPSAVPARVSLSFTTLLTLSTMAAGVRVALPPVSYAKAIDIWVGICMIFVFASLLEFALVNSYIRSANSLQSLKSRNGKRLREKIVTKLKIEEDVGSLLQERIEEVTNVKIVRAKWIDRICRALFPGLFLAFNLFYWPFFMR